MGSFRISIKKLVNWLRRRKPFRHSKMRFVVFVAVFGLLGAVSIMLINALVPSASLEPESGPVRPPAVIQNSPTGSGGQAILFAPKLSGPRAAVPGLPAQGALLGVSTNASDGSGLSRLEDSTHLNRKFDFTVSFTDFNSTNGGGMLNHLTSSSSTVSDLNAGRIPLITWQWALYANSLKDYMVSDIMNGIYDDYITQVADRIKVLQKPIYIRPGHEMNGNWYGWSGCNGSTCRSDAATNYVAA